MAKLGTFTAAQVLTAAELNAGAAAWATWSPTYANLTVGNGTVSTGYGFFGRTVFFRWSLVLGSTSAIGTAPSISLPVTVTGGALTATCWMYDASAFQPYPGGNASSTAFIPTAYNAAGTYASMTSITAAIPFAWTTSDELRIGGFYEASS